MTEGDEGEEKRRQRGKRRGDRGGREETTVGKERRGTEGRERRGNRGGRDEEIEEEEMRRQWGREEAAEGKRDREKGDWESERWRGGGLSNYLGSIRLADQSNQTACPWDPERESA